MTQHTQKRTKSKQTPLVSVVTTTFNSEKTIKEVIHALKCSTLQRKEIIVVDDGSTDSTVTAINLAQARVIQLEKNNGHTYARKRGLQMASGDILVSVDSDVVIKRTTLSQVYAYFKKHPTVAAVTGRLDKKAYYKNFSSVYKNLYMYFYFGSLPKGVTFLYGSFFAIKRDVYTSLSHGSAVQVTDDTDLGQALLRTNQTIHLLKNITVTHMRYFNLKSLIFNDFRISRDWAIVFWIYEGWKQLFRKQTGFAHASKSQITSILLYATVLPLVFLSLLLGNPMFLIAVTLFTSTILILNKSFLLFLKHEQGGIFFLISCCWMLLDYAVMLVGIGYGSLLFMGSVIKKGSN